VLVHCHGEFDFLDDDYLLLFARRPIALVLLVKEFAIVLNAANRGLRCRRNLNQIQAAFAGDLKSFEGR
jgi:hypothetical protein